MSDSTAVLRARIDLPTTTGSVPIARHLVAQLLAAWSAKARHGGHSVSRPATRGRGQISPAAGPARRWPGRAGGR